MITKKIKTDDISPDAWSVYQTFKEKNGANHIASPVGIHVLLEIIKTLKPKRILEVGGGIGTLSYTILRFTDAEVDVFEDQPFCIKELTENLRGFEHRYTLLTDYHHFTLPRDEYDLIIVDGGGHGFVYHLVNLCRRIGGIFVEGGRSEQRKQIRRALRARYLFRPIDYVHADKLYKGAHRITCYRSNNFALRQLAYWFWEIVIFSEIKRSLVYRWKKMICILSGNTSNH